MITSGQTINRPLERGTYYVLVNSAVPNQGGSYTLSSSFFGTPNVLCRHYAMMGTVRQIAGSLGPGSCTLPDGSAFDGYQLTLYGGGTTDIAVTPNGFAPLLILRTSDGYAVAANSATDPTDPSGAVHLVVPDVGSDTYTLIVAVSSPDQAGGSYSLNASFSADPDELCVSQGTMTASQQYNGSISTGSCNFNLPGREDYALFNYYNLHIGSAGAMQVSVDTADFSSLLLLLDADGNTIADDIESGGSGTPLIRQQLAPGDYRLIVFNEDSFGGSYTLNYQFTAGPAPVCPFIGLDSGNQVSGILSGTASCRDSAFLADAYQVVLPVDGTLNVSLSSPDFTTFLDLHDAKDNELTWGTQSADGSASFLTVDLSAGTYYLDAASMNGPGGYAIGYTFTPKTLAICPPSPQIPPNTGYIGQIGPLSCQGPDGRHADFYQFSLSSPATTGIFMTSDEVPGDLTLYQADGTPLRTDQNSYVDSNAVVIQYLQAGNYQIRARSADPTLNGFYRVDILADQGPAPQLCAPLNLPLSERVFGQTSYTSCAWYDKTFADVYQIVVSGSAQILTIGAVSSQFDSFLILMDAKGNVIASDDNSGGGQNALIVQALDPGAYFVAVKPANDATSSGNYVLTTATSSEPTPGLRK